jgi:hypothetical protein
MFTVQYTFPAPFGRSCAQSSNMKKRSVLHCVIQRSITVLGSTVQYCKRRIVIAVKDSSVLCSTELY